MNGLQAPESTLLSKQLGDISATLLSASKRRDIATKKIASRLLSHASTPISTVKTLTKKPLVDYPFSSSPVSGDTMVVERMGEASAKKLVEYLRSSSSVTESTMVAKSGISAPVKQLVDYPPSSPISESTTIVNSAASAPTPQLRVHEVVDKEDDLHRMMRGLDELSGRSKAIPKTEGVKEEEKEDLDTLREK